MGPIAQSVEQRTFNPWVDGSSPSGPTFEAIIGGQCIFMRAGRVIRITCNRPWLDRCLSDFLLFASFLVITDRLEFENECDKLPDKGHSKSFAKQNPNFNLRKDRGHGAETTRQGLWGVVDKK